MHNMPDWIRGHRAYVTAAVVAVVVAIGLGALHHLTRQIRLADVSAAFDAIGRGQVAMALLLTAISYAALTLYDVLALRIVGRPLPWRTAALASFTSYTLSHNLGLSLLTGGSARYRIYTAAGLDGPDVARVVAIAGATFWMGVLTVTGFALLGHAGPLAIDSKVLPIWVPPLAGGFVVVLAIGFVALCAQGPRRIGWRGWSVPLPTAGQAIAQIAVATIDLAAASAALFVLIPGADPSLLPAFVLGYALAIIVALVSHVPGGIGVFEAVAIATIPVDRTTLFAALIAYRVIYYLFPLALGVIALGWHEARRRLSSQMIVGARRVAEGIAPSLLGAACFGGGAVLLLSGSLPSVPGRLRDLASVMPLPFIEASHLAASLVGTGLLLIAPGLYRRLDGAFLMARTLLLAGAAFSLFKGIDYEEAIVCLTIAGLLQLTKPAFYRRTSLVGRPLSAAWLVSIAAVIGTAIWVGFFSYKHVDYEQSLWWQFAVGDDASRFLRSSLGIAVALAAAALWWLFLPAPVRASAAVEPEEIDTILATATRTDAMLALTGDKRFLVSADGDAFVMYQVHGNSWIAMADPVGAKAAWPDLLWQLRSMADAAQGQLLLYQISADVLEIAIEMGLSIIKYGEEALVDLTGFTVEGSGKRSLRQTHARLTRNGVTFAVIPATEVPALIPELAIVSSAWLGAKAHREKGFSLGRFDPAYMAQFDCAVVRVDGQIVAFANVWRTDDLGELSLDLMRHDDHAPSGVMDYLFVELMLWGRAQGYRRFALGLAPLSGIAGRRMAPAWAKIAALLFRHGERLYGFRGLRTYKEKFAPLWAPRYIAGPDGLALVKALRNLNRLISRTGRDLPGIPS
ncbi:bifunctional lysylphosphatidylglycerol flippase/synthetase MprF [Sphingomonas sp. BT553]|uniref:Bifunctional lysylphosphatidylglycerol flippase/synthetase MprF n=2 Tax=Sphingomonas mollis TaxID=2795726 RepID=A0ABS0XMC0_9SPHN|nr:bifunctional lysylphosphatidylglycerol flippase/synthetase MprF [Sphingomonas sp. BT553]